MPTKSCCGLFSACCLSVCSIIGLFFNRVFALFHNVRSVPRSEMALGFDARQKRPASSVSLFHMQSCSVPAPSKTHRFVWLFIMWWCFFDLVTLLSCLIAAEALYKVMLKFFSPRLRVSIYTYIYNLCNEINRSI